MQHWPFLWGSLCCFFAGRLLLKAPFVLFVMMQQAPGPRWYLQLVQWKLLVIPLSLQVPSHSQLLGFKHILMPLLLMLTSSDQRPHPAFSAYCAEINNHAWEREVDVSISPYSHSLTVTKNNINLKYVIFHWRIVTENSLQYTWQHPPWHRRQSCIAVQPSCWYQ